MPVVATRSPEDLVEGRKVRRIFYNDLLLLHLFEALWDVTEADPLARSERNDAIAIVGVDDQAPAEAHALTQLQDFWHDLDAADVVAIVENLEAVNNRVRHGELITDAAAFG